MIIVKLQGGLGNQMFQYATGRALAIKHNVPMFLDQSFLERNNVSRNGFTARKYGLDIFNIVSSRITAQIIDRYFEKNPDSIMINYKELPVSFDKTFRVLPSSVYISGNWQSPKYFANISSDIRQEFTFKYFEFDPDFKLIADEISEKTSVAIHLRRGDYIPEKGSPQIYFICDKSYYFKAMSFIRERFPHAAFFVFSDDIKWSKDHFKFDHFDVNFVYNEKFTDWQEMFLMSKCKHNIMANSTFSWWAAWLNDNNNKVIIAPKNWFNIVPPGFNLNHLYPKEWIRM
ncbi:alpha-1,2-fucosyltransferase [Mucilaginibacter ximonensis]|uniref:Alpha-1,2-fucosyltransferase n=1 Tax=Mucilaginibacter ximonensis TaxID=538021 RepID=A0ABW5YBC8_9SPHI